MVIELTVNGTINVKPVAHFGRSDKLKSTNMFAWAILVAVLLSSLIFGFAYDAFGRIALDSTRNQYWCNRAVVLMLRKKAGRVRPAF